MVGLITDPPERIDARTWGATSSQPIGIRPHRLVTWTEWAVVNHAVVADRSRIRPAGRADARKAVGRGDDAHSWLDVTDGDVFRRAAHGWRSKASAPNGREGPGEKAKAMVHVTMAVVPDMSVPAMVASRRPERPLVVDGPRLPVVTDRPERLIDGVARFPAVGFGRGSLDQARQAEKRSRKKNSVHHHDTPELSDRKCARLGSQLNERLHSPLM